MRSMTATEIRRAGLEALPRDLGPVGMIRFLQQFESGSGDYTAERRAWLGEESVEEIAARIRSERAP